jgi:HNH endonuclease
VTTPGFEKFSKQERDVLVRELYDYQHGICYIDERPIDLSQPVDVDHIRALDRGGQDSKNNWGLTHAACNRGKGNRDLDLLRYLSRFHRAREAHRIRGGDDETFTVGIALGEHGGAKRSTVGRIDVKPTGDRVFVCTFDSDGQMVTREFPLERDLNNSTVESFTALVPIEYVYHDGSINPRSIVDLDPFIEEFYRGNPQLLPSLAHMKLSDQPARIMLFDGQHKAAAQVFLGNRHLYVRVFIDSDLRLLKTANFGAHTKLAQIHFPMAIQDKVGHDLYLPAFQEYLNRVPDRSQSEERTFFGELAPEERSEMRAHFQGS